MPPTLRATPDEAAMQPGMQLGVEITVMQQLGICRLSTRCRTSCNRSADLIAGPVSPWYSKASGADAEQLNPFASAEWCC